MLAITEYNYFKPAAGVPAERSIHNPSFDYERNKTCTSITVIAGIVVNGCMLSKTCLNIATRDITGNIHTPN